MITVPYPEPAFRPGWESDPQTDDGHRHEWEMVAVQVTPDRREPVTRCAVCYCPRCGSSFAPDPCLERRHHHGPHLHESGRVEPIGGIITPQLRAALGDG